MLKMNAQVTSRCTAEEIVQQAAEKSGSERRAFLKASCGTDSALRARVELLLAELMVPPGAQTSTLTPRSHPLTARIDRYRLLQQIGEGGFGTVYLAEQERPVRRRVALKVIKRGMDTQQVIARFEAERQALALMDHPNIARVLDAGTTAEGLPFFVMELVRGTPVTQYCDQGRLPTRERLGLFLQVCQAVQHAHQKGVIHRDLKPGNVLVTRHDAAAPVVPKVIDFGIAKATHAPLTNKTVYTEFRQFMGTPEYMSPEQADMGMMDVDTRSDVYSLGVLLYELLTGTTPVDSKELRGKPCAEIQRTIREVEPPRPSTRLAALGEGLAAAAARRGTEPGRLAQSLRGELDWVVMKCLEKDRTRRYDSVGALAADVQRYLADEPVLARPSGPLYRVGKFARKYKATAAAAGAVAAALVLGLCGTLLGMARAHHERDEAVRARANEVAQRQSAERSREDAETANRFLLSLHSVSAPYDDTGAIRKRLTEVAGKLEAGWLEDRPLVRIAVTSALGGAYHQLGDYPRSERHLRAAIDLSRQAYGPGHPEVACQIHLLGSLFVSRRDYEQAERSFEEALAIFRKSPDTGSHLSMVLAPGGANALESSNRVDAHLSMANTLRELSYVREKQGDPRGAKALRREAHAAGIDWRTKELGLHPGDRYLVFSRGIVHARLGEFQEALADVRRAVELDPADHWGWYYAAYLHLYLGDREGYRRNCREMVGRFNDAATREAAWRTIEACLLDAGALEDLLPVRRALDSAAAGRVPEHMVFWLHLYNGMAHYRGDELEPALLSLAEAAKANAHYVQAPAQFFIAMACHRLGRAAEAEAALARGVEIMERRMPKLGLDDLGSTPEHWLLCQITRREAEHQLRGVARGAPATEVPARRDGE
jgi:serine/threonine protein kinase